MFRLKFLPAGLLLSALLASSLAHAQVDAAQAARLGQDLTPIGGEKAGNAEGTIPAWDGGLARRDDAYDPVVGYKDPFAEDKPLFTISAANAGEYADKLSPEDRWAVVAYVRALQRAANATIDDVPLEQRGALK